MPKPQEIQTLIDHLHASKVINADTSAKTLIAEVNKGITNPAVLAGWYAIGGDHYVIVCGAQAGNIAELGAAPRVGK